MLLKNASVSEREAKLKQGLAEEESRKNINDSKFRAVAQRMDYNGFHQMVLGANLKPTKSGEVFSIHNEKKAIFNSSCKGSAAVIGKTTEADTLIVRWRRADTEGKLVLLENLEVFIDELKKFSDFAILADIVSLCHGCEDLEFVERVFGMFLQVPDFKAGKKMLTRGEKQKLDEILMRIGNDLLTNYLT